MTSDEVIDKAKYLLEFQKEALVNDLADAGIDDELGKEFMLRTFLDEFFRRVLGVNNIIDELEANESAELNRLIEELTK